MNKAKGQISDLEDKPKDISQNIMQKRQANRRYVREIETQKMKKVQYLSNGSSARKENKEGGKIKETMRRKSPKLRNEMNYFRLKGPTECQSKAVIMRATGRCPW